MAQNKKSAVTSQTFSKSMAIALRRDISTKNVLLADLINKFTQFINISQSEDRDVFLQQLVTEIVNPAIGQQYTIEKFDQKISNVRLPMLEIRGQGFTQRFRTYLAIQKFLFQLRETYIQMHGLVKEADNVITGKQVRVVSPGVEAFTLMGNNDLNIVNDRSNYSLIFN